MNHVALPQFAAAPGVHFTVDLHLAFGDQHLGCRYISRPALANERMQCNAAGQVLPKPKTLWHDGARHIVMSPAEFMQRLAALAPRKQLHSWTPASKLST